MRGTACAAAAVVWLAVGELSGERQSTAGHAAGGYLTWTADQARKLAGSTRINGRVGGGQGLLHTERAYNYKLRATWLTGDVIRATARLAQLSDRLNDGQTEALVKEAEGAGDTVVIVEIDPREGSGVIPLDWAAFLGPRSSDLASAPGVKGTSVPRLREVRALSGMFRRDYDYEVFWVVFPLESDAGRPVFPDGASEAELVVRIYNKEGRVRWPVPDSIRGQPRSTGR